MEPFHFDDKPGANGPALAYREHSFFENERVPDAIKNGDHPRARKMQLYEQAACLHQSMHAELFPHLNVDAMASLGVWCAGIVTVKLDTSMSPGKLLRENDYHMRLGANTTVDGFQASFGRSDAKVLRLEFPQEGLPALYDQFASEPFGDAKLQDAFVRRISHLPGFWCCRSPDGPKGKGGLPYQMH